MTAAPYPALRSALFVDFDNVVLGLRRLDVRAADAFASQPTGWLRWLEQGCDYAGAVTRRFLVRHVYLNPVLFGSARTAYTRAGFRVIDCPPLTAQGKNGADICMVLDMVDALEGTARYDEFVIVSADADFTPVLHRLRSRDRRTTVVTSGSSAAAYRAVCDSSVPPEVLADVVLRGVTQARPAPLNQADGTVTAHRADACRPDTATSPGGVPRAQREAVRRAIVSAVTAKDDPLVSSAAAQVALRLVPDLKQSRWWGAGTFRAFLALHVPDVGFDGRQPGFVYDPDRHSPLARK